MNDFGEKHQRETIRWTTTTPTKSKGDSESHCFWWILVVVALLIGLIVGIGEYQKQTEESTSVFFWWVWWTE